MLLAIILFQKDLECISNISKIDESFINVAFEFIDNIAQDETKDLYDILMIVLEDICGYRTKGYYYNLSLFKLESAIINCVDGKTILDDFCGMGVSANEIANSKRQVVFARCKSGMCSNGFYCYIFKRYRNRKY